MIRIYFRHPWLSFRLRCRNWLDLWRGHKAATRKADEW